MDAMRIHSFNSFVRMMYAYSTPEIARHDGWLKIGDTEQGVQKRIKQHTHTADVRFELEWKDIAMFRDDCTYFRDHDFTSSSDIDWSKSIAEIDKQLFDKYGLDEQERNFIRTKVKEMA